MTVGSVGLNLEPSSARKAVLAAARRVAASNGADAMTAEAVAEEAGCTPDAIQADFADMSELQLAVVADDLAALAALMRGSSENKTETPGDETAPDADLSLKEIEQAIGVVLTQGDPDSFEEDFAADTDDVPDAFPEDAFVEPELAAETPSETHACDTSAEDTSGESGAQTMTASIAELERNIARLEARPVNAWLERRLRVFERTLADIEGRMEKAVHDSTAALAKANESGAAIDQRVDEAVKSAGTAAKEVDRRQSEATDDLRHYVKDLSGRLSVMEKRRHGQPSSEEENPVAVMPADSDGFTETPVTDEVTATPVTSDAAVENATAESATVERTGGNFLDAARRAANSAAVEAAKGRRHPLAGFQLPGKFKLSLSLRTLRLATGIFGLVVVLLAVVALLHGRGTSSASAAVTPGVHQSPDMRVAALAKSHNPEASLVVGLKFLNGDGIARDLPSAAYWLGVAARGHEPVGEYWFGTLYERGRGAPESRAKAMQWYEAAAKAGNAKAMYRLGVAYVAGWSGEPDYAEGAKWFVRAAKLGVIDAQYNLAVLYERGEGVAQSFANAFTWYAIAARQGDAGSKARLDSLASQLSASTVDAAQKKAMTFVAATPKAAANIAPTVMAVAQMTMK